jgi:hypothetical protein
MTDTESRLARLEQWRNDHVDFSQERFNRNDKDHQQIMQRLNKIETNTSDIVIALSTYKKLAAIVWTIIGAALLVAWEARHWIVHKLGH